MVCEVCHCADNSTRYRREYTQKMCCSCFVDRIELVNREYEKDAEAIARSDRMESDWGRR